MISVESRRVDGTIQTEERCPVCFGWHNRPWREVHSGQKGWSEKTVKRQFQAHQCAITRGPRLQTDKACREKKTLLLSNDRRNERQALRHDLAFVVRQARDERCGAGKPPGAVVMCFWAGQVVVEGDLYLRQHRDEWHKLGSLRLGSATRKTFGPFPYHNQLLYVRAVRENWPHTMTLQVDTCTKEGGGNVRLIRRKGGASTITIKNQYPRVSGPLYAQWYSRGVGNVAQTVGSPVPIASPPQAGAVQKTTLTIPAASGRTGEVLDLLVTADLSKFLPILSVFPICLAEKDAAGRPMPPKRYTIGEWAKSFNGYHYFPNAGSSWNKLTGLTFPSNMFRSGLRYDAAATPRINCPPLGGGGGGGGNNKIRVRRSDGTMEKARLLPWSRSQPYVSARDYRQRRVRLVQLLSSHTKKRGGRGKHKRDSKDRVVLKRVRLGHSAFFL